MKRLSAFAVVVGALAALSGCATPCCFCYCGEIPTQNLVEANVTRPEITPDGKIVAVAVRY